MTFGVLLFLGVVMMVALLSVFFIVCRKYEEGVLGNFVLGFIIVFCAMILADACTGALVLPAPHYVGLIIAMGGFLARHAYRFAMFHWHGYFGWKRPGDMPQAQDAGR